MNRAFRVSEINSYVKNLLDFDRNLSDVRIEGEISNLKRHYGSGHLYFTLKDELAAVSAVMFASDAAKLAIDPSDGVLVTAQGRISLYERDGRYQFYVRSMTASGDGALLEQYNKLRLKLEKEGLFAPELKKPLPAFPSTVGIVTSLGAAALQDVLNVLSRRMPSVQPVLFPSAVQGAGAAAELRSGIEYFSRTKKADVVLLVRGGGSIEDLWAFNDEALARAIASSEVPVISGVGHETDFTIADFAASVRAPTPSAAAELAVPEITEQKAVVRSLSAALTSAMNDRLEFERARLGAVVAKAHFERGGDYTDVQRLKLDSLEESIRRSVSDRIAAEKAKTQALAGALEAMSPYGVLRRGYAIIEKSGNVVSSAKDLAPGDKANLVLHDGSARAEITQ
ncbi:MAG: exodeoxyribonuclease VII large subunit [Clostridia bacterium]|nr:exodeoxyribonuclease VII large subunit [Clostridia bacterium]